MSEFIKWFSINYPELKKSLMECNHNFDDKDINPYHIEGDCWSHTMMVCKIADIENFSKIVQVAALLHDIAKPECRDTNPKKKFVYFTGHEEKSATMAKPILENMVKDGLLEKDSIDDILTIIKLHGEVYKNLDSVKEKLKNSPKVLQYLLDLNKCDNLGRFNLSN